MTYMTFDTSKVEWLTLLLHIREVPSSSLGWDTGYPNWDFSWFFSVPPSKVRDSALNLATTASVLKSFQFTIHLSPLYLKLQSELLEKRN
jgi:hypothetical protein